MNANVTDKPFIKKFIDGQFFYIYDVNTNQIVEVEKSVYDIIDRYVCDKNYGIEAQLKETSITPKFEKNLEKIKKARLEQGIFSNFKPKKVTLGIKTADGVKELHSKGLRQIVIELTRDCPLNCSYCPTSGKYSRNKTLQTHMSRKTCRKSLDFFCERAINSDQPYITFYGGEPLKRFDLIRETVEYVKKKYSKNRYGFNLTTNGILFNKENIDFFIENDIELMVSIDGPKEINDRYRRFKNGKGTFNRIMKNLLFLKQYNAGYYSRNVSISSVLSPPFDKIDEIINFFSTDQTIHDIKSKINSRLVDTKGTSFIKDFGLDESYKEYSNISEKLVERLKRSILDNNLDNLTIEKKRVYTILYNLAMRTIKGLYNHVHPLGACHIGLRRLFVSTSGDFYICERGERDYNIGCIDEGFDYEKIAYYYRKFDEVLEDCRYCWALNHCERCWAVIGNLEEFTGKRKEQFCSYSKKIIEKAFKVYTQLLREKPDCLKVFKDVLIA
jgi:uncharacterized protein